MYHLLYEGSTSTSTEQGSHACHREEEQVQKDYLNWDIKLDCVQVKEQTDYVKFGVD